MIETNLNTTEKFMADKYNGDGFFLNTDDSGIKELFIIFGSMCYSILYAPPDSEVKRFEEIFNKEIIETIKEVEVIKEVPIQNGGVSEATLLRAIALAQTPSAIKEIEL